MKAGIAKEHVRCDLCGADATERVASGREHEYENTTPDEFTFVRCKNCGLVYLDPRPAESELGTIYPENYYAYQLVERRRRGNGTSSLLARYMRSRAVARLRPYVERLRSAGPPPYRVLDIGCGDGATLDLWREAFGAAEVETHGIEMDTRAAEIARERGHVVTSARVEEASFAQASFDVVYASHVIEHVPEPTAFLTTVHGTLSPRGIVIIDTPNFDTIDRRIFGRRHWGAYHFPRHFFIFDEKTFGALAEKAGFDIAETRYFPSAVMWVWTCHSLLASRSRALADRLFPPVDVFLSGSPWNVALLATFTSVDLGIIGATGRSSNLRVLLRAKRSP